MSIKEYMTFFKTMRTLKAELSGVRYDRDRLLHQIRVLEIQYEAAKKDNKYWEYYCCISVVIIVVLIIAVCTLIPAGTI
jgi:type IV secretory pathway component VirB8